MSTLYENVSNIFNSIFNNVKGFKALVLDSETSAILSLVCTQSYLLDNEVFLTLRLDDPTVFDQKSTKSIVDIDPYDNKIEDVRNIRYNKHRNLKHIPALFIIRPTNNNIDLLCTELSQGIFGSYHFAFTNTLSEDQMNRLAKFDSYNLVKSVFEYYTDFYTLSDSTFSIEQRNVYSLYKLFLDREYITLNSMELNKIFLSYYENDIVNRIIQGLFALCCATGKKPTIIYRKSSPLCQAIASQLQAKINDHNKNIPNANDKYRSRSGRFGSVLLLYDRRDDCITPLLTQWTYQAMIHEYIGIHNNKIKLQTQNNESEEFVVSSITDSFFNANKYLDFEGIEAAINNLVGVYKKGQVSINKNDIFETLQLVPDQAKLSADVKRHLSIQQTLTGFVKGDILNQSILEQDICCDSNKAESFSELYNRIQAPDITPFNRLKLCCLFAVCYSDDKSLVNCLKSEMRKMRCSEEDFRVFDNLLKYSKSAMCKNVDRSIFFLAKTAIEQTIKDTVAYMRYNSRLSETLDMLLNGKLDGFDYVTTPCAFGYQYSLNEMPESIIAFVVGGATYQESRECDMLKKKTGVDILLGGTNFISCRSFFEEMAN